MKTLLVTLALAHAFLVPWPVAAAEETMIVSAASEAAEGLDLNVVAELFREAETLEDFERALNDPEIGANNLDLNDDGEVDFIRVLDEVTGDAHLIVLQALLGEDQYQDVATIEIERTGEESYNFQVHGHASFYGPDYYIVPAHVHIHTWPCVVWIYRPVYRPYRSAWYWGYYPRWYRPYPHVHVKAYRTRTAHYHKHASFKVVRTSRVTTVNKIKYTPRTSTLVRKRMVGATTRRTTIKRQTTTTSGSAVRGATKINSRGKGTTTRKATATKKRTTEKKKATTKKRKSDGKKATKSRKKPM